MATKRCCWGNGWIGLLGTLVCDCFGNLPNSVCACMSLTDYGHRCTCVKFVYVFLWNKSDSSLSLSCLDSCIIFSHTGSRWLRHLGIMKWIEFVMIPKSAFYHCILFTVLSTHNVLVHFSPWHSILSYLPSLSATLFLWPLNRTNSKVLTLVPLLNIHIFTNGKNGLWLDRLCFTDCLPLSNVHRVLHKPLWYHCVVNSILL